MKQNLLLYAILILLVFIAAQGRTVTLIEPVQPTHTVILEVCYTCIGGGTMQSAADPYLKKGYIVKQVDASSGRGHIVLEKY